MIIDNNFAFKEHINNKIKKQTARNNFKEIANILIILHMLHYINVNLVRSQLYNGSIWVPHKKGLIELIKKVQKRTTKFFLI